jgi:hypothetical protein
VSEEKPTTVSSPQKSAGEVRIAGEGGLAVVLVELHHGSIITTRPETDILIHTVKAIERTTTAQPRQPETTQDVQGVATEAPHERDLRELIALHREHLDYSCHALIMLFRKAHKRGPDLETIIADFRSQQGTRSPRELRTRFKAKHGWTPPESSFTPPKSP